MNLRKKAVYPISYPFLAGLGLLLGYGFLIWERRLSDERAKQQELKQNRWLAGVDEDEDPFPEFPAR